MQGWENLDLKWFGPVQILTTHGLGGKQINIFCILFSNEKTSLVGSFTNVTLPSDFLRHCSLVFASRAERSCRQIRDVLLHAVLVL